MRMGAEGYTYEILKMAKVIKWVTQGFWKVWPSPCATAPAMTDGLTGDKSINAICTVGMGERHVKTSFWNAE